MSTAQDTFQRATTGFLFSQEEYAGYEQRRREDMANAYRWLALRFNNVREEEICDRLARDIRTIMEWEADCQNCTDIRQCKHSRAILEVCQECNRDGFRDFVVRARPCDQLNSHAEQVEQGVNFDKSGIPAERQGNTFESFSIAGEARSQLLKAKGTAKECAEQNMGLILGGPVGCGKTHLAIAMGIYALKDGRKARFYLLPELLESLRNERWNHESALLEEVKRCDLLILDDAGTESAGNGANNWKDELFFTLVNYRYDHKLPLVITTNATGQAGLQAVLSGGNGERIYSRLMEMTVQVWIMGAPDYRQKKKQGDKNG